MKKRPKFNAKKKKNQGHFSTIISQIHLEFGDNCIRKLQQTTKTCYYRNLIYMTRKTKSNKIG